MWLITLLCSNTCYILGSHLAASSFAFGDLTEHYSGVLLLYHILDLHQGEDKPVNITMTATVRSKALWCL